MPVDTITTLCTLLEEKKDLFLEYEKATQDLLSCDVDSAEHYITQRDKLANEIDEISEKTARICADYPAGDLLLDAANARVDFARVPGEYQCVFYGGQAVRSVVSRISETEKQALEHLRQLRNEALEGVKMNKEVPKIKKYLTGLTEQPQQGGLRDKKV